MPSVPASRTTIWLAAVLALLLFGIYNANFRHGSTVDTISTTALPISILHEGDFDLDEFQQLMSTNTRAFDAALKYFGGMQERDGHLVSNYPLGAAVLAVPFFAVADASGYLQQWHHYRVTGKIAASAMTALAAVFVFLSLQLLIDTRPAWLLALLFGLGTSAWSISSQELWQHGPGTLCLAVAVYALLLLERRPTHMCACIAGAALGLAVYCRLLNAIPTAALSLFVLLHHRKYLLSYLAPLAAMAVVIAYYNLTTFGTLSGGYDAIYRAPVHGWRKIDSASAYNNPLLSGLADILISPSRGLLVYSPFLIAGFIAAILFMRQPRFALQRYLALWVALMCIVLAKNTLWWGGASYGPRYFSETCLALALLTAAAWPALQRHRGLFALFLASGVFSIFVHGVGAFLAPCGWESEPVLSDLKIERFWDWHDPEIARCAGHGLEHGFKAPEILQYRDGDQDM